MSSLRAAINTKRPIDDDIEEPRNIKQKIMRMVLGLV